MKRRSTDKGLRLSPQPDRIPEPEPCAVGILPKLIQFWSWTTALFSPNVPSLHELEERHQARRSMQRARRTSSRKTLQHEMKHPDHFREEEPQ